jgi:mannosyltransferase OCH1-like enzyme
MSRDFIATEYPWFLSTYDGYSLPIQRVDTVRYFILRHYGGIYLDLDNVGLRSNSFLFILPIVLLATPSMILRPLSTFTC